MVIYVKFLRDVEIPKNIKIGHCFTELFNKNNTGTFVGDMV